MLSITPDPTVCTVIVTLDGPSEVIEKLVAHAKMGIERFLDFGGYLGGALHLSEDGERLVQYLRWQSIAAYTKCTEDPAWDEEPTTAPFLQVVQDGHVTMDVRLFDVIAISSS